MILIACPEYRGGDSAFETVILYVFEELFYEWVGIILKQFVVDLVETHHDLNIALG